MLAANDAARNLLGAASLSEVLNVPFSAWLEPAHHEAWAAFAGKVSGGSAASLECEVKALTGARRSVLVHGIPVLAHPDKIPSILVVARDVSDRHEIEKSLEEREGKIRELELELDSLQSQLTQAQAERRTVQADLDALSARIADAQSIAAQHVEQAGELRQIEGALVERLAIIESLEVEKRSLQDRLEALEAEAGSLRDAKARADERVTALEIGRAHV